MTIASSKSIKPLSPFKKIVFTGISILFPIFLLIVLEISLRIAGYGKDFSLFVDHPDAGAEFAKYKIVNPEIGAKYFQHLEYTTPTNDVLLKNKDEGSFRIFVMGSSSVVGFPYDPNLMFPRILQSRLQLAYPQKRIEVINTAITAINSYTLLDFTKEILAEKPDAILIYAGHNEYYGAFGVGSNEGIGENRNLVLLHLKLMDLRFYQLIRNSINRFSVRKPNPDDAKKPKTLMSRMVKNAEIAYQSEEYRLGLEQYRANMTSILQLANDNGVKVFIGTLVSNLEDLKPFGSDCSGENENAENMFQMAQIEKQKGNYKLANELFTKARDYDCIRFRASSDINKSIVELAAKFGADLVPVEQVFIENSPNGIIGNSLLTEHVHPNISGYFLMSEVFYKSIVNSKILSSEVDSFSVLPEKLFRNSYGYTALDSLLGNHRIENLKYHWPFRKETDTYIDYRTVYKPMNFLDSLAFKVMISKELSGLQAHLELAGFYLKKAKVNLAFNEYKAVIRLAPSSPELLEDAGSFFISAGDLPLAFECFENSLKYQNSYFANFRAGEICLIQNNLEKAILFFKKALTTADQEYKLRIFRKLYICYSYMGKRAEANLSYKSMLFLDPKTSLSVPEKTYTFSNYIPSVIAEKVKLSNELLAKKKYEEALELLNTCLEINNSPLVSRMIASIYIQKQNYERAGFYLGKAYSWFHFEPTFLVEIIRVQIAQGKNSQAKESLKKLMGLDPNNPNISVFRGSLD